MLADVIKFKFKKNLHSLFRRDVNRIFATENVFLVLCRIKTKLLGLLSFLLLLQVGRHSLKEHFEINKVSL